MKYTHSRITKTLWLALFACLAVIPFAADAQKKKDGKANAGLKARTKKVPEGAVLRNNKVTLKAGYQFEKPSGNTVAVRKANGGISGSFNCACQQGTPGGGNCTLTITKELALCSGSCTDCRFEVTIDPVIAPIMKAKKASN